MGRPWNFKSETRMRVLILPLTGYVILGVFRFFENIFSLTYKIRNIIRFTFKTIMKINLGSV